jgi:hypothetical protein
MSLRRLRPAVSTCHRVMNSYRGLLCFVLLICCSTATISAQGSNARISGQITDPTGRVVPGTEVQAVNIDTNVASSSKSNGSGIYVVSGLIPGRYRLMIRKDGFKMINKTDIVLNVQDILEQNFALEVGSISESITVTDSQINMNTTDGSVSTVVDRKFAEDLPLNGRSFQTLIQLTPGVIPTPVNSLDEGQFSINGQRAAANYWMIDGVSANIGANSGASAAASEAMGGALGGLSSQGGTNSLVSVDAMQEFRIQTSTYAPEFGRTPGGQISIVTRSGTNQFHGSLFDYFRNDVLDANDWFADHNGLAKPPELQNDFGGIFSGPILKNRTFFFFSYEGLRLRLPVVLVTTVPSLAARQTAAAALQPILNMYPAPNSGATVVNGTSPFNASVSNASTLDAYSIRGDHRLSDKIMLFARFNYSPSQSLSRGGGYTANTLSSASTTILTGTAGATWTASPSLLNDLRFNVSKTNAKFTFSADTYGGAVPLASPFTTGYSPENADVHFNIVALSSGIMSYGKISHNTQRQINIVDNLSWQKGSHALKFGVDFRRLTPGYDPPSFVQTINFATVATAEVGTMQNYNRKAQVPVTLLLRNLGVFAQDTWRANPRLTFTYGLRWDVDVVPTSIQGPQLAAAINYNDLATLALAPDGTPLFKTPFWNIAPRFGVAYQLSQASDWQTVLRGGFGVFFDLATSELGNTFNGSYPIGAAAGQKGGTYPAPPATAVPPPITPGTVATGTLSAFYPHLQLPYTMQWSVALEQGLGGHQSFSVSYVGAAGRRLMQTEFVVSPNVNVAQALLVGNTSTSDYDALQVQFQRQLSHGLQVLASYAWAHSIDTASAGSFGGTGNTLVPTAAANTDRGDSDFDIRHAFSAAFTYSPPAPRFNAFTNAILGDWSLQSVIQARTAPPVNVYNSTFFYLFNGLTQIRPDLVPLQPLYLYGSQYIGGRTFNVAAFTNPPLDATGNPTRDGNAPRNLLRGYGLSQWDFGVHREFPIEKSLKLQFRAEMFNVLNHPNFSTPSGDISNANFGQPTSMYGAGLGGGTVGQGALSTLYQSGGPRSIQLALKLSF